jgi:hypothetical protein
MRALLVFPLVLLAPLVIFEGCKDGAGTGPDAVASTSSSLSASASASDSGPHTYGDLTEEEITDALKRKRVIAIVRVKAAAHDDVGTKNESIRYELELIKPLNGSPPSESIQRGAEAAMVVGRPYAVVIDRRYLRLLVRAVEIPEEKIKDVAASLEASITKIAPLVAASASADDADDDAPPSPSASGSASTKPSSSSSGSASAKPSVSAKPSTSAKPSVAVTAPKPPASVSAKPK